jgi:hypothetical protein
VLLFCSGIAVDEPARKANTAKAANVVLRFMRTNPFLVTALSTTGRPNHFLADCIGLVFSVPYPLLGQQSQFQRRALRAPTSWPASVAMGILPVQRLQ